MQHILFSLMLLILAVIANIISGTVYNTIGKGESFEPKKFFTGVLKGTAIAITLMILSFIFMSTDLSSLGVTPELIMNAGMIKYSYGAVKNIVENMKLDKVLEKQGIIIQEEGD